MLLSPLILDDKIMLIDTISLILNILGIIWIFANRFYF